jgi:hypothetical protein|tara:strand:- start:177 stop:356 length:180 start_codon:yes stop_codon:yes gene_type:complete
MTAMELYEALNKADLDYDVIEIFEGSRWLKFEVDEEELEEDEPPENGDVFTQDLFKGDK